MTDLDPLDALLLAEAPDDAARVLVLDGSADLIAAAQARWDDVATWHDLADGPTPSAGVEVLPASLLAGVDLVLAHLPKSNTALDEYAQHIRSGAAAGVRVVAGGRVKHMTPTQNDVLRRSFDHVHASRGVDKCRVLHAAEPLPHAPAPTSRWPRRGVEPTTGLTLVAHGATFAGARLDAGTRLLLDTQAQWRDGAALDFGCGNGVLTAVLARRGNPTIGLDISRAAIASTRATLTANGLDAELVLTDMGLADQPDDSLDLIVTNPPFHAGTSKDSSASLEMIHEAARVLRPGGELWCVFNAHLPYLQTAGAAFGRARLVAKDRNYQVLRAVAQG